MICRDRLFKAVMATLPEPKPEPVIDISQKDSVTEISQNIQVKPL